MQLFILLVYKFVIPVFCFFITEDDLDSVHVVDFGNALRNVHSEVSIFYNDFELQTPLYRAPEVRFGLRYRKYCKFL